MGSSLITICGIRLERLPLSPQLEESFVWPTHQEILAAQKEAVPPSGVSQPSEDALWTDDHGKVWIPDVATSLQVRVCVVGHFDIAGHRGILVTQQQIGERFFWTGMRDDIEYFVKKCLHCASTVGGPPQPRLLGEAMHADEPNELIHWDF
ncbi:Integrase zinc binding domain [Phytophthora infestans]|uniref:Integrase zinc binding domain n=1 Tax=Phytophthora infestans TaxID=4787 RepID=A0A8S9V456_PHYIN|nr:Integrase zinc binding domain [Phytophthora infestans]